MTDRDVAGNLTELDVRTREEWRRWLAEHYASSPGVWLVRHKQHTGVNLMSYEEVGREALCFGWIDSLIKRLDANRYALKVTPRQPTSKWSEPNRKRWRELPQGLEFFQTLSTRNRRDFVVWIHTAKRRETRERRLHEAVQLLSSGKKLGLK